MSGEAKNSLQRLNEGNARFAANVRSIESLVSLQARAALVDGHTPFAVVLGCSDARVPAETVFDQGLGSLFVIRIAGNIVAPSQIGSVEFAVERFGIKLVVVLGHTHCGAIEATFESLLPGAEERSQNLRAIVSRIQPVVAPLLEGHIGPVSAALRRQATRANVRASVRAMRSGSPILESLVDDHGLWIVGAEYNLEDGKVDFFDLPSTEGAGLALS